MVPQLGPSAAVDAVAPAMPGKPGLAFAVTGGLGGLGLLMADALAHEAASQVVLTGRSGRAGGSSSLRGLGGRCGGSASDERAACFGTAAGVEAQPGCGRLGGVLHAAGVLADGMAVGQTASRMRVSFAPKVPSASGMATTAQLQGLQMCVQFSSISALCGSSGQTNYASSNSVLDYLAGLQRTGGVPCRSLQWGPWSAVGMATQGRTLSRLEMMGLTPLAPLAGLGALGHAVQAAQGGGAVCANAPSYWAAFLRLLQ